MSLSPAMVGSVRDFLQYRELVALVFVVMIGVPFYLICKWLALSLLAFWRLIIVGSDKPKGSG